MALLDWIVIGAFCCALVGIVLWVISQKNNNSADYFLGVKMQHGLPSVHQSSHQTSVLSTLSDWLVQVLHQVWLWPTGRFRDG